MGRNYRFPLTPDFCRTRTALRDRVKLAHNTYLEVANGGWLDVPQGGRAGPAPGRQGGAEFRTTIR